MDPRGEERLEQTGAIFLGAIVLSQNRAANGSMKDHARPRCGIPDPYVSSKRRTNGVLLHSMRRGVDILRYEMKRRTCNGQSYCAVDMVEGDGLLTIGTAVHVLSLDPARSSRLGSQGNQGPSFQAPRLDNTGHAVEELEETARLYLMLRYMQTQTMTDTQAAEIRRRFPIKI